MTAPITMWTVVRTGRGLTVTGKGATGEPVKITRVDRVDSDLLGGGIAVRGEERWKLA